MRQLTIVTLVSLVFACSTRIEHSDVVAAERARADAIARRDAAAYGALAAPDLVVTDVNGDLRKRDDRIDAITSGAASNSRRVEDDVEIRVYGELALVMGRADSQEEGQLSRDYFTRIWANRNGKLEMVGAHYTQISRQAVREQESFSDADRAIRELPVATTGSVPNAETQVMEAIREQHEAYWSKDPDRYRRFAGEDLLRVAENGVSNREQLIAGMRGNARLPAPPSAQLDVNVRMFGNTAIATWLDKGEDLIGRPAEGRFTVVLVRRGDGWQMVHIQTTGVRR